MCAHPNTDFQVTNKRGFNCFQYAALKGNSYAMKKIIEYGGNQYVEYPKDDGFLPLHLASLNGHFDAVSWLLQEGNADILKVDNRGQNCLHCAIHQGHVQVGITKCLIFLSVIIFKNVSHLGPPN